MALWLRRIVLGLALVGGLASAACAGMGSPSYPLRAARATLADPTRQRLEAISFFLVAFFVLAGVFQFLWNAIRKDFTVLPRLNYGKAVGVVALWGLLFLLILTMIAGARELMTPGAWKQQGVTYRLARESEPPPPRDGIDGARYRGIERLRAALWRHAQKYANPFSHTGARYFPRFSRSVELLDDVWQVPGFPGSRYVYVGDQAVDRGANPLAYEPSVVGSVRLVLLTDGQVREMTTSELQQRLEQATRERNRSFEETFQGTMLPGLTLP